MPWFALSFFLQRFCFVSEILPPNLACNIAAMSGLVVLIVTWISYKVTCRKGNFYYRKTLAHCRNVATLSQEVKYLEVFSSKLDQLVLLPYSREKVRFLFWLIILRCFNPLRANFTKWSNTLKHFVGILPTNCLSVFGHFVGLALKGLRKFLCGCFLSSCN